jgi:tol-pal system protein YbgF
MARISARTSSPVTLSFVVAIAASSLALPALGCARGKSAEDRQIDELRDEITRVQSESDKFEERLGKLEIDSADIRPESGSNLGRLADATPQPARTLSAPRPMATPSLRVVHLSPDGAGAPDGAEEAGGAGETAGAVGEFESPDPGILRIQGSGSDAAILDKGGKVRRPQDAPPAGAGGTFFTNANLGPALASHAASRPSALDEDAKHTYDAALALVNGKHYPEALEALAGFLVRWPDHPNADNAMYWRGECYFAQGDYTNAANELDGLIARFPLGNKAPDALLKLGLSELRLGDTTLARQRFDHLRREFPHSEAAKHIPEGAQTVRTTPPARSNTGEKP